MTDSSIDYSKYDHIAIWLGYSHTNRNVGTYYTINDLHFDPNTHGKMLNITRRLGKIPVFYSYIIGFAGRYLLALEECEIEPTNSLCQKGSNFIRNYKKTIISIYNDYSSNIAKYIGEMGFCVFLIEPEFYQYFGNSNQQGGSLTGKEMAALFNLITATIKNHLPNAAISWDISTSKINYSIVRVSQNVSICWVTNL